MTSTVLAGPVIQPAIHPAPADVNGFQGAYSAGIPALSGSPGLLGTVALTVSKTSAFTGAVRLGAATYRFKGDFGVTGTSSGIPLAKSAYSVVFNYDKVDPNGVDGILVSGGSTVATFVTERQSFSKFSPCPFGGNYTVCTTSSNASPSIPQGSGYGTLKISALGGGRIVMVMADGTKATGGGIALSDGRFPLIIPLYKSKGAFSAALLLRGIPGVSDMDGVAAWSRPPGPANHLFPAGFSFTLSVVGSRYDPFHYPDGLLNFGSASKNAEFVAAKVNGGADFVQDFYIDSNNKYSLGTASPLTLAFDLKTGLFSGAIKVSPGAAPVKFAGAVLQRGHVGRGLFTLPAGSGGVTLSRIIQVAILSPADGVTSLNQQLDITGTLSVPDQVSVTVGGATVATASNGIFTYRSYSLFDGENDIPVAVTSDSTSLFQSLLHISWHAPTEAGQIISASGGSVAVTNTASPLLGAGIIIPAGAVSSTDGITASIIYQPEDVPNIPAGFVAVGPPVIFEPVGQHFLQPTTLVLPLNPSLFPPGASGSDVQIIVNGDSGWMTIPSPAVSASTASVQTSDYIFDYVIPVVPIPINPGELRIVTNPPGASIYIDGANAGVISPGSVYNLATGTHKLKLYLPGYNELFTQFDVTGNAQIITYDLTTPVAPPVVTLDPQLVDGMLVSEDFLTVSGLVTIGGSAALIGGNVMFSINGQDYLSPVTAMGFSNAAALLPGENTIQVRANAPNGDTGVSRTVHITNTLISSGSGSSTNNIKIVLTWDNATDLDLHTFDPSGNHAWYGDLTGIPGAILDHDNTTGYGPEIFTMLNPTPGVYHIRVDYYNDYKRGPSTATLNVYIGNMLAYSNSYVLTVPDYNSTSGKAGNPASIWDAYSFNIADLVIDSIVTEKPSPLDASIFTTGGANNQITVHVQAPVSVPDSALHLQVVDTSRPAASGTLNMTGVTFSARTARFTPVTATPPSLADFTRNKSVPIQYQILVYTSSNQHSDTLVMTQDIKSQIRQEYVDAAALFTGNLTYNGVTYSDTFNLLPPDLAEIIGESQYTGSDAFTYNDYSRWSDYGMPATIIGASRSIANSFDAASLNPLNLTSAWRNPRRTLNPLNTGPSAEVNDYHQTGGAVDFNPRSQGPWFDQNAPVSNVTYLQALRNLYTLAQRQFPEPQYKVLVRGSHPRVQVQLNVP